MSAYQVGLTGGLASGKSTVAHLFAACGIEIVDADAVVGELTACGGEALPLLSAQVGDWVLTADGAYNRTAVREKIFHQTALKNKIEAVLHPLVRRYMQQRLAAAASPYVIGIIPLLFEDGDEWTQHFQRTIVVDCRYQVQLERANRRDSRQDAEHIIAAQMPAAERLRRADDVIDNNGTLPQLFIAVYRLHEQLLAAAK